MSIPSYVQPLVDDSFTRINAVILLKGLPDTYLNWDVLSLGEQADVDTLYTANENVFPLAHESKMDVVRVTRNGNPISFREAFATKLLVRNSRPRMEITAPSGAPSVGLDSRNRLIDNSGVVVLDPQKVVLDTFETVSKGIRSYPANMEYVSGVLTTIVYTTPAGSVVKSLGYTSGLLTSIVLSGSGLPPGVQTTKTLSYTSGVLSGVNYS